MILLREPPPFLPRVLVDATHLTPQQAEAAWLRAQVHRVAEIMEQFIDAACSWCLSRSWAESLIDTEASPDGFVRVLLTQPDGIGLAVFEVTGTDIGSERCRVRARWLVDPNDLGPQ